MSAWFPQNISTYGADLDRLFVVVYYIVGAWFVAAEVLLLYLGLRYRRREGRRAAYVRGESWAQLAWVLVPAVVVLGLDLAMDSMSAPVWSRIKEQRPASGILIRGTAKQFTWAFAYSGPDGKFDTGDDRDIENELHVPAGENILIDFRSKDVIHSFFVPTLRLKQDIVPGRTTRIWFNATTPGRYEISCAELCGFGHYTMRGFLVVHDQAEYEKWRAETWSAGKAAS